jgi:hypothetical protein
MSAEDIGRILELLALQGVSEGACRGPDHGSTICRLPVKSWQADILRTAPDVPQALDPMGLRKAMQDPGMPIIFVPEEAIVTREVIERICVENPLNKMIIWETD